MNSRKKHWETIYQTKRTEEFSWTEEIPETSLRFIHGFHLPKNATIIDVGGGESHLAGFLLDAGYTNISVLDISARSIEKAKKRLGVRADQIQWINQDITEFQTNTYFDCWHDRAAFHFLTSPDDIEKYSNSAKLHVRQNGYMIIGTFSELGPESCSGLSIRQYNPDRLGQVFSDGFKKLDCVFQDHETPSRRKQHFLFCSFRRI